MSILGSISLALIFEIVMQQGKNFNWITAPYFWGVLLGFFLMGGYWLVTRIDSLYKVRFVSIMSALFFISLSFGYLTFANGKAEEIKRELEDIPVYDTIMKASEDIFDNDEKAEPSHKERDDQEGVDRDAKDEKGSHDRENEDADEASEDDFDIESERDNGYDEDMDREDAHENDFEERNRLEKDASSNEDDASSDSVENESDDTEDNDQEDESVEADEDTEAEVEESDEEEVSKTEEILDDGDSELEG